MLLKTDKSEIIRILEMHSNAIQKEKLLKEQFGSTRDELQSYIDSGCIKNGVVKSLSSANANYRFAIFQQSTLSPGQRRYLFPNGEVADGSGNIIKGQKWDLCRAFNERNRKKVIQTQDVEKSETDKKTIEIYKKEGWIEKSQLEDPRIADNAAKYGWDEITVGGISLYRKKQGASGGGVTSSQTTVINDYKSQGYMTFAETTPQQRASWPNSVNLKTLYPNEFSEDFMMYQNPNYIGDVKGKDFKDQTGELSISKEKCKEIIDAYFEGYSKGLQGGEYGGRFEYLKSSTQKCRAQHYDRWGFMGGERRYDNILDLMAGEIDRFKGVDAPPRGSEWRIKALPRKR